MRWITVGAASAFVSVATGAFGAHALKARLAPELLVTFETGARYQLYHALGMIVVGLASASRPSRRLDAAGWSMLAGTVLFSGSLYALALTGVRALGTITPLGGVAFLAGWALLAWEARR
jgi:uncharacterized membrane protein YgdD (TMEM256/DUF423 family)